MSYTELLDRCNQCFNDIKVTPAQVKIVEESTRSQAKSKIWFQQRSGCITAYKLKAAVRTNVARPSRSLIMSICYPESQQFYSKATQWGCKHEQTARDTYVALKEKLHQNLKVRSCGLFINPTYPHMGATPDGIITCTCCSGMGVLEVKCPYSCRDKSFLEATNNSNFYLKMKSDGGLTLNTTHSYYYQVQAQIKLCNANFCDFVVWNEDLFIEQIMPDDDFIESVFIKATTFFKVGILPELMGNWYSNLPMHTRTPRNLCDNRSSSDTGFDTDLSPDSSDDQHELVESDDDSDSLTSSTSHCNDSSVSDSE